MNKVLIRKAVAGITFWACLTACGGGNTSSIYDLVVAADGSGDCLTIQEAVNLVPDSVEKPFLIFVKNGTYEELVVVPEEKRYIHLIGQDKEHTRITYKINCSGNPEDSCWQYSAAKMGIKGYGVVFKVLASDFYAENISFENAWGVENQAGPQALAMNTANDRISFYNCAFRSFQDTWLTVTKKEGARHYANKCYIEGAVDYIYGEGDVLFDSCMLYNVRWGSVIVAPSHREGTRFGYVFNHCTVDGNEQAATGYQLLGRPWHNQPRVVYMNTTMNIPIKPIGWTTMGTIPALMAECNSCDAKGMPLDLSQRRTDYFYLSYGDTVKGSCRAVLSADEVASYTYENIVKGTDGWNPRAYMNDCAAPANLKREGKKLRWDKVKEAASYVVIRNRSVIGFTRATRFEDDAEYPEAVYEICPVNNYGSVGKHAIL